MELVARHGFCRRQVWRQLHVGDGQREPEREPKLAAKLAELFTPRAPPERTRSVPARGETPAERRRATLSALARSQPVRFGVLAAEVRVAGRSVWVWGRARYLEPRGAGQVDIIEPGSPSALVWARLELAGLLLEQGNGSFSPAKLVAGREAVSRPYDAAARARAVEALRGVVELASPEADEPWAPIGSWCRNCGHKPYCFPLADAERDLSLVSGLPRQTAYALRERGITTVDELASEDAADLAAEPYSADTRLGPGRAARLIARAQAHRASRPIRRLGGRRLHDELAGTTPVAFDVETLPGSHTVVLWGLRAEGDESPTIVDAGCGADWEHQGWEGFLRAVERLQQRYGPLRLCHFGRFETTVLERYRETHGDRSAGTGPGTLLLDVWLHVSRALALPVTGYTQKDVEAYLGFQRPSAGKEGLWASAQLSLCQAEGGGENRARRVGEVAAYLADDLVGLLHVIRQTLEIPRD